MSYQHDKYAVLTAVDRSGIHSLMIAAAKKMVEQNVVWYSSETTNERQILDKKYSVRLVDFKHRNDRKFSTEYICDLSNEEQVLLVLLAAAIIISGDSPE